MKIAHIFSYFGEGGTEDHALLLARKAKDAGNEVFFIISEFSDFAIKKIYDNKIRVIILPMNTSFNIVSVLKSAAGLKNIIESANINIIHTHMLREQSISIIAKMLGAKFSLVRSFHRFNQFNYKMIPLVPLYRMYTDAVIAISIPMSKYLKHHFLANKMHLIENGVEKVTVQRHEKALGFIGRLTSEKGILNFIRSNIKMLQSTKLVIAGDGPDASVIQELIKKYNLRVQLLGKISNKADFYRRVSVLVLPSSHEVMPLVVLEAYSCGLPVAVFNLDLYKGLIDKSNGYLVEFPDYETLGDNALKLLNNPDRYRQVNLTKFKNNHSDDIMWSKTFKLYQSLLD